MNCVLRSKSLWLLAIAASLIDSGCVSGFSRTPAVASQPDPGAIVRSALPESARELHQTDSPGVNLGPPEPLVLAEVISSSPPQSVVPAVCPTTPVTNRSWWNQDVADLRGDLCDDLESLITRRNAIILAAAGGVSFAFHETLDDDIAADTARHENRWGGMQDAVEVVGNPFTHLAAASGIYAYGLVTENAETHELGKTLLHATALTTVSSTLLKFAANTERPNGDPRGWPSGHTASSFAVAAVLDEYYGAKVAIPAYALAGLVAWERIDDREHDLSDVVFGAALGYVIGRAVASEHHSRLCGMQVEPYFDPASGASGVALERRY